ncbi:MAG: anti-sigma-F factor Fin [Paenisporosarcina sp.]|nr:anti-sigma-F factor Fin [Paenisporosarcina sp.]
MAIRVKCRHCDTLMGYLPSDSAERNSHVKELKEEFAEEFISKDDLGKVTIKSTCEHCEQSLRLFPNYYAINKWIQ